MTRSQAHFIYPSHIENSDHRFDSATELDPVQMTTDQLARLTLFSDLSLAIVGLLIILFGLWNSLLLRTLFQDLPLAYVYQWGSFFIATVALVALKFYNRYRSSKNSIKLPRRSADAPAAYLLTAPSTARRTGIDSPPFTVYLPIEAFFITPFGIFFWVEEHLKPSHLTTEDSSCFRLMHLLLRLQRNHMLYFYYRSRGSESRWRALCFRLMYDRCYLAARTA